MEYDFLTVKEAAKKLRIHPETVRRFIREKKIKGYKVGKSILLKQNDMDSFVSKCISVNI